MIVLLCDHTVACSLIDCCVCSCRGLAHSELDMSHCRFSGTIPSGVWFLGHLESLDLSYNQLTGRLVSTVGSLSDLRCVWWSNGAHFCPTHTHAHTHTHTVFHGHVCKGHDSIADKPTAQPYTTVSLLLYPGVCVELACTRAACSVRTTLSGLHHRQRVAFHALYQLPVAVKTFNLSAVFRVPCIVYAYLVAVSCCE